MPFGALGRLSSTNHVSRRTETSSIHSQKSPVYSSPSLFSWAAPIGALLIHPSVCSLVSFASTADFLRYLFLLLPPSSTSLLGPLATMPRSLRLPKTPVKTKTSVVRHDEHSEPPRPAVDPACPICQVDIGTKSPEGVREGYAVTPCAHVFGSVCIKKYLAITADKPLCPVCRTDLYHVCAHPVLPACYDPKKSSLSREEAAAKAFPDGHRNVECDFCLHRRAKAARRMRKRELLERMTRVGRSRAESGSSSSASASASASSYASGSSGAGSGEEEEEVSESESGARSPSGRTKALRLALHIVHSTSALARLTLDTIRIRKIKASEEQDSPRSSDGSEVYDEEEDDEDEDDGDGDIVVPDSPQLAANRSSLPPVPGSYGHWDLANKGPDWKFLGWYDSQEPKMRTTPEQFS